jgi:hypothetical protein
MSGREAQTETTDRGFNWQGLVCCRFLSSDGAGLGGKQSLGHSDGLANQQCLLWPAFRSPQHSLPQGRAIPQPRDTHGRQGELSTPIQKTNLPNPTLARCPDRNKPRFRGRSFEPVTSPASSSSINRKSMLFPLFCDYPSALNHRLDAPFLLFHGRSIVDLSPTLPSRTGHLLRCKQSVGPAQPRRSKSFARRRQGQKNRAID